MINTGIEFGVYCSSRWEYPKVFDEIYTTDKYPQIRVVKSPDDVPENALSVTGEIGDQCFGSMVTLRFLYPERTMTLDKVIETDMIRKYFQRWNSQEWNVFIHRDYGSSNLSEKIIQVYEEPILKALKCIRKDVTWAEFLWAVNFYYKYYTVLIRKRSLGVRYGGENANAFHFFDTPMFNAYAVTHYKENSAFKTPIEYKDPAKKYILEQNGDLEYYQTKEKINSGLGLPYGKGLF